MALVRVTKRSPCPVCGRDHYCSVTADGAAVFCTKEPSDRPSKDGAGWWHRLEGVAVNGNGHRAPTVKYPIHDADGTLVAYHCRVDVPGGGKRLWWELPDGTKKLGRKPEALPLYGIEAIAAAGPPGVVVVTEGEKARDALKGLLVPAVGTVTGADVIPSVASLEPLVGFDVCLWPDNDEKGRAHMAGVARRLVGLGVTPRVFTWAEAPEKGDAADFVAAGLGVEELNDLYAASVVVGEASPNGVLPAGLIEHRLSDLTPEDVHWLWPGRIPLRKITVLDGDPGLGKSTLTLDIAARLTRGDRMPDGTISDHEGPGAVLLLAAEDGLRDTILPRLIAAGANPDLVFALEAVPGENGEPDLPVIPRDIPLIEERIRLHGVKLVIVDPLVVFLGDSATTNTWRDQDIRRALTPFGQMLERADTACVCVRHLTKGGGPNALYRGGGSIGIIGAARSGLIVNKDPDDDTGARRVMAPTKNNLAAPAKAMAYHMEQAPSGTVVVVWEGETEHTAAGLLADPLPPEERGALDDAVAFLRAELRTGRVESKELMRRARAADHSQRSIERARRKLGVLSAKGDGPYAPWFLSLPAKYLKGADGE